MAKTKEVALKTPLTAHDRVISKVTLREPNFSDYIALGDPVILARNADGALFPVDNGEVLSKYIERCLVDLDPLLLAQIGLTDAMAIKREMNSFFLEARESS